jgi:hypothetical protein
MKGSASHLGVGEVAGKSQHQHPQQTVVSHQTYVPSSLSQPVQQAIVEDLSNF